jgi:formylglycine-generating enzyme
MNSRIVAAMAAALVIVMPAMARGAAAESIAAPTAPGLRATAVAAADARVFKDCVDCPEMVIVPAGTGIMGSTVEERTRHGVPAMFGDREGPAQAIRIAKAFALGRTEVTRGQYARFVTATGRADPPDCAVHDIKTDRWAPQAGYSWRRAGFPQSDDHPALCISYADAAAYAAWLARQTGKPYRLPSETEWEYAARAGTTTAWYWGEFAEDGCSNANLVSSAFITALGSPAYWRRKLVCFDTHVFSLPVASYPANPFGLHDMSGNAFEWVADCASTSHEGGPTDGSVRTTGADCKLRFLKGGAFHTPLWLTRSAVRGNALGQDLHMGTIGLRVARDL